MKSKMVMVTSKYERFVHWLLAISCLLLCYTGLGIMYKELNFLGFIINKLHKKKEARSFLLQASSNFILSTCFTSYRRQS